MPLLADAFPAGPAADTASTSDTVGESVPGGSAEGRVDPGGAVEAAPGARARLRSFASARLSRSALEPGTRASCVGLGACVNSHSFAF